MAPCILLLCLGFALEARAQAGISALPSVYRVASLEAPEGGLRLALDAGYGVMGDVLGANDTHHRALVGGGVGGSLPMGLAAELRLDARYDAHKLEGKDDDGAVLDPRLVVRYTRPLSESLLLALQVGAWFPGKEFPKPAFDATTMDFTLHLTKAVSERVRLSVQAGYRLDNSANAADHPELFSPSDYVALGLSSFDALLAGVGLRASYGRGDVLAELAADVLLGGPSFTKSPMHLSAGVDHAFGSTRLRALVNVALSARPEIDVDYKLVPLLPRVWMVVGVTHDLFGKQPEVVEPAVVEPPPPPPAPPVVEEPKLEPAPPTPEPEPAQPRGVIRVVVRDTDWGDPLEATVTVLLPGKTEPETSGQTTKLSEGMLELPVSPGRYEVRIEARGYTSQRRTLSVDEGGVTVLNVDLKPKEKR